jgi:hypothetical protein
MKLAQDRFAVAPAKHRAGEPEIEVALRQDADLSASHIDDPEAQKRAVGHGHVDARSVR